MADLPLDIHEYNGQLWFQSSDRPELFYYIPTITPQKSAGEKLATSLISYGRGGMLMIGASLSVNNEEIETLKRHVGLTTAGVQGEQIQLEKARLDVKRAALWLGDGDDVEIKLSTNESVGPPPHSAIFSVHLDADQFKTVKKALDGERRHVEFRYEMTLSRLTSISLSLTGDVSPEVERLASARDEVTDAETLVKEAIESGRVVVAASGSAPPESTLYKKAEARALAEAATWIQRIVAPRGNELDLQEDETIPEEDEITDMPGDEEQSSLLEISVQLSEPTPIALEMASDLATWFTGTAHTDLRFVKIEENTTLEEEQLVRRDGLTVKINGDWPHDLPVKSITLTYGDSTTEIDPGDREDIVFEGVADQLHIKTSYKVGRQSYEFDVPVVGSEHVLSLEELGIIPVTIDATKRLEAGSKKIKIDVRYDPEEAGNRGREIFNLRDDDGPWIATWIVISRAPELAGTLKYQIRETTADNRLLRYESEDITDTHLFIEPTNT